MYCSEYNADNRHKDISPVLELSVTSMVIHLSNRIKPGMAKSKVREMGKVRAKKNRIIIVEEINNKTLLRTESDSR